MGQKIVITGGAGFIGSHLADACCRLPGGPEVVVLDNLRSGRRANLERNQAHANFRWVEGSICDAEVLDQICAGADWIFHLAALISVPESLIRPRECVELNVNGTLNVLEAARKHAVKKVVLSSSAAVYGDDPELPKHEKLRPAPQTPYGITKLDGEYYLEMYRREYGISTVSLRYFNVFGPHQDPTSQYAAAVPIFIQKALAGETIGIFGDGLQTRDFVYVGDVAAANLWVAQHEELHGVFNVATGSTVTILQLAQTIRELLGSDSQIEHLAPRPGDIRASWSDPGKLLATGFRPQFDLASGLRPTLEAAARRS
ncbi:MAG: NAD-dependent epimerase/dehydratase family protein [Candidatus Eremiobacteraeota bacterium]|nr:NAD-dependent epimerase/dehydratase family protein [Candidatus Eremiobacteraeota bacterium]MCW5872329.1 NAD-dependent epimerase/dehydratase family protein [Candidatus Eremiobacteraeota bacterium]